MQLPASQALVPQLVEVATSPSTNAELAALARQVELPSFATLVTDDQTAGKGRLDRTWVAPAGSALAISVLVVPETLAGPLALDRYGWLPIAAGVAMSEAIARVLPAASTGFKWPNDVLVGSRKICGVLAELLPDRGAVVIGAGVNLAMTAEQLPVSTATSIAVEGGDPDPDTVLSGYLGGLQQLIVEYLAHDGDAEASGLADRARGLCVTLGREVRVELPGGRLVEGTASDLDADGRLVVDGQAIAAGDVTHARLS